MQKIIYEKEGQCFKLKVSVNTHLGRVRITRLWKWDGATEEVISLNRSEAMSIASVILAAFSDDTADLIKGMYENYLNENNEK